MKINQAIKFHNEKNINVTTIIVFLVHVPRLLILLATTELNGIHIYVYIKKLNLNISYVIDVCMLGPNLNRAYCLLGKQENPKLTKMFFS